MRTDTWDRKLKVVHVLSGLELGDGITQVVKEVARALDKDKFDLSVCSLTGEDREGFEFAKQDVPVYRLSARSSFSPNALLPNVQAIYELARLFKAHSFDIVHTHEFFSGTLGRVAAKLAGVPVVVASLHNKDTWKGPAHVFVDRLLARMTDRFIANSRAVRDFTMRQQSLPAGRWEVIYNGIDPAAYEAQVCPDGVRDEFHVAPGDILVASIGRLVEQKGFEFLVEAAKIVGQRRGNVRFLIIGGPGHPSETRLGELKRLVEDFNLQSVVTFAGLRRDIPRLLSACDVFVLPSLWEGFGIALVEAMMMGKAVVATRVDAIPEVVCDGVTGILVPPRSAAALADQIVRLADDQDLRQRLGDCGKRRAVACFTSAAVVSRLAETYYSLARAKGLSCA